MSERVIADALDKWLRSERLVFRRDRMDKATTCIKGWPDFEIIGHGNRVLWIELKTETGKLSADQVKLHHLFSESGCNVHVCRSISQAVEIVQQWLSMLPAATTTTASTRVPAQPTPRFTIGSWDGKPWLIDGGTLLRPATSEDVRNYQSL